MEQDANISGEPPHWAFEQLVPPLFHGRSAYDIPGNLQFQAHSAYEPSNADEVGLSVGDWLKVKKVFRDGWCYVLNVDREEMGLAPM
ncbi:hypothetical protein HDU93_009875 [Gonapodya sp. JEL0774]|nr:hypothetical protein HDU93_009875 [Gonapodya sp. JEL0774]